MLGCINITTLDRVLMNIFNLLPHHIFTLYQLGMHAFLPELIRSIAFMRFFIKSQLLQNLPDIIFS